MKLCDKQGNGICCDCSDEFKQTVICRKIVEPYIEHLEDVMEDMIKFMYLHCERFDSQSDVVEYFEVEFNDGRVL